MKFVRRFAGGSLLLAVARCCGVDGFLRQAVAKQFERIHVEDQAFVGLREKFGVLNV